MESQLKKEPIGKNLFINVSPHHTFGTDAVLLSYFACPKRKDKLVDLGTGCGIIPFLMLRDVELSSATGVDISEEAIFTADKTLKEQNFKNLNFVLSDLKDLKGKVPFGANTLVTCNPPYKAPNAGLKNDDSIVTTARHEVDCTLSDIIKVSAKLLQTSGRLCMCHRPERLSELMSLMSANGIEPKRLRLVSKQNGSAPWLVLVEGRRGGNIGLTVEPTLYVYENGELSPEMLDIYGPYKEAYL